MKRDPLDDVERLVSRARGEASPAVDVATRVLATLALAPMETSTTEPEYVLIGMGSLMAACVALALFLHSALNDAFVMMAQPFVSMLP